MSRKLILIRSRLTTEGSDNRPTADISEDKQIQIKGNEIFLDNEIISDIIRHHQNRLKEVEKQQLSKLMSSLPRIINILRQNLVRRNNLFSIKFVNFVFQTKKEVDTLFPVYKISTKRSTYRVSKIVRRVQVRLRYYNTIIKFKKAMLMFR